MRGVGQGWTTLRAVARGMHVGRYRLVQSWSRAEWERLPSEAARRVLSPSEMVWSPWWKSRPSARWEGRPNTRHPSRPTIRGVSYPHHRTHPGREPPAVASDGRGDLKAIPRRHISNILPSSSGRTPALQQRLPRAATGLATFHVRPLQGRRLTTRPIAPPAGDLAGSDLDLDGGPRAPSAARTSLAGPGRVPGLRPLTDVRLRDRGGTLPVSCRPAAHVISPTIPTRRPRARRTQNRNNRPLRVSRPSWTPA